MCTISLHLPHPYLFVATAESLDLQHLGRLDEGCQLTLGHVHTALVHELDDGREIGGRRVLEEDHQLLTRQVLGGGIESDRRVDSEPDNGSPLHAVSAVSPVDVTSAGGESRRPQTHAPSNIIGGWGG